MKAAEPKSDSNCCRESIFGEEGIVASFLKKNLFTSVKGTSEEELQAKSDIAAANKAKKRFMVVTDLSGEFTENPPDEKINPTESHS